MEVDQINSQILLQNKRDIGKQPGQACEDSRRRGGTGGRGIGEIRLNVKDAMLRKENDDGGEDEPVVLKRSGKGTIPCKKHKELRIENDLIF